MKPADLENAHEIGAWRRDIHAHPELGFDEQAIADFLSSGAVVADDNPRRPNIPEN